MLRLYTDGGVIKKNPSPYGGTWAYMLVNDLGTEMCRRSGVITPAEMGTDVVTNNQTELLAVIYGLQHLLWNQCDVEICSDSEITLGRVFKGYAFNNIPNWMFRMLCDEQARLSHFPTFTYTLMDGHPTKSQVEAGIGKKGHVTSKWNALCDRLCNEQAEKFMRERIHQTISESK